MSSVVSDFRELTLVDSSEDLIWQMQAKAVYVFLAGVVACNLKSRVEELSMKPKWKMGDEDALGLMELLKQHCTVLRLMSPTLSTALSSVDKFKAFMDTILSCANFANTFKIVADDAAEITECSCCPKEDNAAILSRRLRVKPVVVSLRDNVAGLGTGERALCQVLFGLFRKLKAESIAFSGLTGCVDPYCSMFAATAGVEAGEATCRWLLAFQKHVAVLSSKAGPINFVSMGSGSLRRVAQLIMLFDEGAKKRIKVHCVDPMYDGYLKYLSYHDSLKNSATDKSAIPFCYANDSDPSLADLTTICAFPHTAEGFYAFCERQGIARENVHLYSAAEGCVDYFRGLGECISVIEGHDVYFEDCAGSGVAGLDRCAGYFSDVELLKKHLAPDGQVLILAKDESRVARTCFHVVQEGKRGEVDCAWDA